MLLGAEIAFTPPATYHGMAHLRSLLNGFPVPENFCRAKRSVEPALI